MCHVLIIEDEAIVALDIQACLQAHGATSFAFAETEGEAIAAARQRLPEFITSDVQLRVGAGPSAVEAIQREMGCVPVLFITGTPEACKPCEPPARVFSKPMNEAQIGRAFRDLAPI